MSGALAGAAAAGARKPWPDFAASTSRAMTRPCGPVPWTRPRSMFASFAKRRAKGEEKILLVPPTPAPWPLVRTPPPPPPPLWGEGAGADGGGDFASFAAGADVDWAAAGWAAPSPRGGEGGVEGAPALGAFAGALAADAAAALGSSPSCAITAMSWLTATSLVPSGTTILAMTPSSTASYSMVALSVSISAITSPVLTASPSFLSHLERLPFSMVGDSAGMRMLMGMMRLLLTRNWLSGHC